MRSLLVVHAVDRPGGAELALLRAAPLLAERGWRMTMTGPTGRRPAEAPDDVVWRQQPVGGLGRGQGLGAVLAFRAFRALAAQHDVVYLNGTVPARLLPALQPPGGRGGGRIAARTAIHVHDMTRRVPRFWGGADVLLADSRACAHPVGQRLGRDVVVTGCPVDLDPPAVAAPWTVDDRPVIAFVGRIEPRKGPLDLIAAAEGIRVAVPRARIVIVGEDSYDADPHHARLVDRRADAAGVERWPWQTGGPGLLRHVDVLVVPSHREPFGTIAAEAQAVGVPVVASAVDGLVEVVQDGVTGRLVPPGDPAALAHGAVWALRERTLLADGCRQAARAWALDAFADRVDAALRGHRGPADGDRSATTAATRAAADDGRGKR
ncbi:glycosyltransferase [Patulibacter defluvii]|uniref:glycosyltransferase n=1 Tax=Patulibacter defluvii TaxID=3095358 RepID=UPI002A7657B0|nr:glycosyltransferase [Patulibacter sp. DM4]